MPEHHTTTRVSGAITDIFAHRFVVETSEGRILADVGPKGATQAALSLGETVDLEGEMKPSELKVSRIIRGGQSIDIAHEGKSIAAGHDGADPTRAVDALRAAGSTVIGQPRRKPKHFEVLTRDRSGKLSEVHVEHDGAIRKRKPIESDDEKWALELKGSSVVAEA